MFHRSTRRACLGAALATAFAAALVPPALSAAELAPPAGDVLLTVSGAISVTNAEGLALLDREALAAMGTVTFETTTNWTEGLHSFTGVPLAALLETLGAERGTVRVRAINDYAVEIPAEAAFAPGPVIALEMDGAAMSVRDKGPLWIVYPYDADAAYRTEEAYSRSVWQLVSIEVLP